MSQVLVVDVDPRLVDGRQSQTALAVARGTGRLLTALGFVVVRELPLMSGRRADVVALGGGGEVWIVEIKSSAEDFRSDRKWPEYRLHCDRFFFAAPPELEALFPPEAGLILADAHGAAIVRTATEHRMLAATRKAVTLRFATAAAARLHALWDPGVCLVV